MVDKTGVDAIRVNKASAKVWQSKCDKNNSNSSVYIYFCTLEFTAFDLIYICTLRSANSYTLESAGLTFCTVPPLSLQGLYFCTFELAALI
jgi:hypothetical protein